MAATRREPAARRLAKPQRAGRKAGQIGPNIVRAWFDSVFNPLLRAVETERALLQNGNWTWRFRPPGLEMIRPARAYIEPDARDNLKQVATLNPDIGRAIEHHDKRIPPLADECREFHQALVGEPALHDLYRRVTSPQVLAELKVRDVSDLFGAYPEEDHIRLLAQYIVNNAGDLPPYHTVGPVWNRYRNEFIAVRERPNIRGYYESTVKAGEALLSEVSRLSRLLEEKRMQLSLDYDQPYVIAPRPTGTEGRTV